jgi:hypothetical protein
MRGPRWGAIQTVYLSETKSVLKRTLKQEANSK